MYPESIHVDDRAEAVEEERREVRREPDGRVPEAAAEHGVPVVPLRAEPAPQVERRVQEQRGDV